MPIPTKQKDETEKKFINRCMSDRVMIKEYPETKQRVSVCMAQAKKKGD